MHLPNPPSDHRPDAEERVLCVALDEERGRTTALRRELDDARVALARAADEIEGLERHRDIWADRGAQMRTSLKELREELRAGEAERDALRARLVSHDGDLDRLRIHRDIWAERARALATALCRDPATEPDAAVPARKARPAVVSLSPVEAAG